MLPVILLAERLSSLTTATINDYILVQNVYSMLWFKIFLGLNFQFDFYFPLFQIVNDNECKTKRNKNKTSLTKFEPQHM